MIYKNMQDGMTSNSFIICNRSALLGLSLDTEQFVPSLKKSNVNPQNAATSIKNLIEKKK